MNKILLMLLLTIVVVFYIVGDHAVIVDEPEVRNSPAVYAVEEEKTPPVEEQEAPKDNQRDELILYYTQLCDADLVIQDAFLDTRQLLIGKECVVQLTVLSGHADANPVAWIFARRMLG